MRLAMEEGELARGTTGDNPWVGCVIVGAGGELLGRGHTLRGFGAPEGVIPRSGADPSSASASERPGVARNVSRDSRT